MNFHHYGDMPVLRLDMTNTTTNDADSYYVESEARVAAGSGDRVLRKAETLAAYKDEQTDEELIKKLDRDIRELREEVEKKEKRAEYLRQQAATYARRNTALRQYMKQRLEVIKNYRFSPERFKRTGRVPLYLMQALRDCEWEEDAVLPDDRYFDPFTHYRRRHKEPKNPNKIRGPFS